MMKVEICYDSIKETIEVTNFYKEIAEKLVEIGPDPAKTVRCLSDVNLFLISYVKEVEQSL